MERLLLALLFLCLVCWLDVTSGTHSEKKVTQPDTCGSTFNQTTGVVHHSNASSKDVPKGIHCIWNFVLNDSKSTAEVVFILEEFLLDVEDSLSFQKKDASQLDIGPFKGVREPFMVSTGVTNVTVTLQTSSNDFPRLFQLRYYIQDNFTYDLNNTVTTTLLTPFYEKNRKTPVCANIKASVIAKATFKLSTLLMPTNVTDNLHLKVADSESRDGNFSGSSLPLALTSEKELFLGLRIQPNGTFQQLKFSFQAVNKECSSTVELKDGGPRDYTMSNPPYTVATAVTPSLNCHTIVFTRESVDGLNVFVGTHFLPGPADQLFVLNGTHHSSSSALLHLTAEGAQTRRNSYVLTNDKEVSMKLFSPFPCDQLNVSVKVAILDKGGYYEDGGLISLSQQKSETPAVYLLKVDPAKQVRLNLTSPTPKRGSVKFYDNFWTDSTPFATLSSLPEPTTLVVSPSHLMMVIAEGFNQDSLQANFGSIDPGCFGYGMSDADSYTLSGKCLSTCVWRVPPKVNVTPGTELRKMHFSTVSLGEKDSLRVVQEGKAVVNVSGPLRHLDDLLYSSNLDTSLILQRDCSRNATRLFADYAPSPKCEMNATLNPGQSMVLSSPGYPNNYPTGTSCRWFVDTPPSSVLHVTFDSVHLSADTHNLSSYGVYANKSTSLLAAFIGPDATLPRDFVLQSANLSVFFSAPTPSPPCRNTSASFRIVVTAADCGEEMLNKDSGSLETPAGKAANTTDAKLCFWLVGLSPSAKGDPKKIFQFNSTTNSSSLKGFLEVHEGSSVRDTLAVNLTGNNLLSRQDYLLFVYRNPNQTAPGPCFSFKYITHACNETCKNGICMHDDWKCNDRNDCGDWSDEKYCEGPAPGPTPGPSPTPDPSKPVSGVSSSALAGGILGGLIIGAFIGVLAPVVLRWYRSRSSTSEYTTLMSGGH